MSKDSIEDVLEELGSPVSPSPEFAQALSSRLVKELQVGRTTQTAGLTWRRGLYGAIAFGGLAACVLAAILIFAPPGTSPASALEIISESTLQYGRVPPFRATLSGRIPTTVISSENPKYTGPDGTYAHKVSYTGPDGWRLDVLEQSPPDLFAGSAGSFQVWDGATLGVYQADTNSFYTQQVVTGYSPLGLLSWDATGYSNDFWKDRCANSEVLPDEQIAGRTSRHIRCGDLEGWIDAETGLMLKIASREAPHAPRPVPGPIGLSPGVVFEITAIEYNPAFSQGTFEATPPAGAEDASQTGEEGPTSSLVPGQAAPLWSGDLTAGGTFHLTDLRGRPTLVLFWADWCEPCIDSLPQFQAASVQRGAQVNFLSVAEQASATEVDKIMQAGGYTFRVVDDATGDVAKAWGMEAFPAWVLLDAQGRVIEVRFKPQTTDELNELLAKG